MNRHPESERRMPSVSLRYRIHFTIYVAVIVLLIAGGIFPMIATWGNYWQAVRRPKWFVIPLILVIFTNCCWKAFITSSELQLEENGLLVRRFWGRQSLVPFSEIARVYRITRKISLIRTNQGRWISLPGLTADGLTLKLEIEAVIDKHLSRPS
jgi:hypothetical protein